MASEKVADGVEGSGLTEDVEVDDADVVALRTLKVPTALPTRVRRCSEVVDAVGSGEQHGANAEHMVAQPPQGEVLAGARVPLALVRAHTAVLRDADLLELDGLGESLEGAQVGLAVEEIPPCADAGWGDGTGGGLKDCGAKPRTPP